MKIEEEPLSDPLVIEASMDDDDIELVLTAKGMAVLDDALERLREIDPTADYQDVLKEAFAALIEELEAMN